MGDRIGGAKLMVNLHIAIYIVIRWAVERTSTVERIHSLHRQAQAQKWTGGGSAYSWAFVGALTFHGRRSRVLKRLRYLERA